MSNTLKILSIICGVGCPVSLLSNLVVYNRFWDELIDNQYTFLQWIGIIWNFLAVPVLFAVAAVALAHIRKELFAANLSVFKRMDDLQKKLDAKKK